MQAGRNNDKDTGMICVRKHILFSVTHGAHNQNVLPSSHFDLTEYTQRCEIYSSERNMALSLRTPEFLVLQNSPLLEHRNSNIYL